MTNINCKENCVHQQDGKCTFDSVVTSYIAPNESKCMYYKNAGGCQSSKK